MTCQAETRKIPLILVGVTVTFREAINNYTLLPSVYNSFLIVKIFNYLQKLLQAPATTVTLVFMPCQMYTCFIYIYIFFIAGSKKIRLLLYTYKI